MNPNMVAQNRTARLVREASTPVYTTVTPVREHVEMVEVENDHGFRQWVSPAEADELVALCGYSYSDVDHSTKCWCFK